jgi:hypothetical protein
MTNDLTIERTVEKLRKRFDELLPQCGGANRLAKRLSEIDSYFGESVGIYHVTNAKQGLCGEIPMTRILKAMEKLAKQMKKTSTKTPPLEKSLKKMGITNYVPKYAKTQELKDKMQKSK